MGFPASVAAIHPCADFIYRTGTDFASWYRTHKGNAELIRDYFGRGCAWFSVAILLVTCVGALLSELSGLAGVGLLMGVPIPVTMSLIVIALIVMVYRGSYLSIERIAIAAGAFELVFLFVAWQANPEIPALASGSVDIAWHEPKYLYLVAANIGTAIMPWMLFYQQSSVVEKNLSPDDLPAARLDTALGAVVTQIIMAAVLIATAATLGNTTQAGSLDSVQQIAQAITPYLGRATGEFLFCLGLSGAAVVATIVVTLTAARALSEVLGTRHSLKQNRMKLPGSMVLYGSAYRCGANR